MTVNQNQDCTGASTTFELCEMENNQGPFKILQYSFVFRDSKASGDLQATWLKSSFDRLTQLYPIMLGHRERVGNRNIVVVSAEDLQKEKFIVHQERGMTVDDFDKIKYCRDLWPPAMATLLKDRTSDIECFSFVVVVCFRDGYLVSLSVSHLLSDVSGMITLLHQWGSIARQVLEGKSRVEEMLPDREIDFDHARFWQRLAAHPPEVHPHVAYTRQRNYGNANELMAKAMEFINSGVRGVGGDTLATRVLHVSAARIAKISERFNNGKQPLHGVQIFYAIFWQRYVATVQQLCQEEMDIYNEPIFLNMICNVRRVTDTPNHVGNAVTPVYVRSTLDDLLTKPIIETAYLIKSFINSVTPGAAAYFATVFNDPSDPFVPTVIYEQRKLVSGLTISNASRLPFLDIDLGCGKPTSVLCGTVPTEGLTTWVPNANGGADIYLGAKDNTYELLKSDPVLSKYVDFMN
ncbi:hypothetical protein GGI25_002862 [Coemansia spiralis]|uniref:Uncharacterized protein n=2 Tax=Coemansia TaxID=4863 RepID=A0A9W8G9N0_9FUNG|nr:hypothetical protein BX070DRAFT_245181 [Coemansia spiralis]KAJ1992336.1 hypothetical protein EDC05_002834 [Coemansia umbellata]KAJ2622282.1 hypothetical protein GGI26_003435 [Coemansia sp. RSA 1358]KAJ2677764.1 hypothetical protein GGI25_002862 [Coemansia spiralis]